MWKMTLTMLLAAAVLTTPLCLAEAAAPAEAAPSETTTALCNTAPALEEAPLNIALAGVFPEDDNGRVETGSCYVEVDCQDGTTISCTSTTGSCSSSPRNCPSWPGSVTCEGTPFNISKKCAKCPKIPCPDWPGCTYEYNVAKGCCFPIAPSNPSCQTICE